MIDTHSHLLPWLDHGCPDLETSLLMAQEAAASGVSTIVCTPHLAEWSEPDIRRAGEVIEEVRGSLAAAGVELSLVLGFEIDMGIAVTADAERFRTLAIEGPGRAVLLETPYSGWPVFAEEAIFRMSTLGFVPVLAHPERNDRIQASSDLLARCLKAGAVAQATSGSLGGEFDRASTQTFFRLVSEGLIGLLASDAHAHRRKGWTMIPMLDALDGLVPEESLVALTEVNPARWRPCFTSKFCMNRFQTAPVR